MTLDEKLKIAFQLTETNQHENAIEEFKKIIHEDPKNIEAYEGIIGALVQIEDYNQAIKYFASAKENNCITDLMHISLGMAYLQTGNINDAKKHLQIACNSTQLPKDKRRFSYILLGSIQLSLAEIAKDKNLIQEEIKYAINNYNSALKFTNEDEVLDLEFSLIIHEKLGKCFNLLNDFKSAFEHFDKIIKLDPNNDNAHYQRGKCLKELGQYQEAIESFDEAIRLSNNLNAYHAKSTLLINENFYEDAIACLNEILKIIAKKNNDESLSQLKIIIYRNLGDAWIHLNEIEKAIAAFNAAIRLGKYNITSYYQKATALLIINQTEQSLKTLAEAIDIIKQDTSRYDLDTQVSVFYAYIMLMYASCEDKQAIKNHILAVINQLNNIIKQFRSSANDISAYTIREIDELNNLYADKCPTNQHEKQLHEISEKYGYKEIELHHAAKYGNLNFLNLAPADTEINALNEFHQSSLVLAVVNGHSTFAKKLIQYGALINLANIQLNKNHPFSYKTALNLAVEQALVEINQPNQWEFVEFLLLRREFFTTKHLDHFINCICLENQPPKTAYSSLQLGELLHENIEIITTQHNINKYLAHLMDRDGTIKELDRQNKNEGSKIYELGNWNVEHFFIFRLCSYFTILEQHVIALNNIEYLDHHPTSKNASYIYELKKFILALLHEILISLETLRCIRDGILVKDILDNTQVPKNVKSNIKKAYLLNIHNKILNLADNQVYVFYTGRYNDHGLYINFSRDSKTKLIHRRIDNLGSASERHIQEKGKIYPCQLPAITAERLFNYLENIYHARFNSPNPYCFWKDHYSLIYDGPSAKPDYYTPAHQRQSVVNCVVKNKNVGEEIRMGSRLYQKLLDEERKVAQKMDLIHKNHFDPLRPDPTVNIDYSPKTMVSPEIIHRLPRSRL